MTHVACRLTAKSRDQLRNPTLDNRVWATVYSLLIYVCLFNSIAFKFCFRVDSTRTPVVNTCGDRAFSVAEPRAWNRLPTQLVELLRSTTYILFVADLKRFCSSQPMNAEKQTGGCLLMRPRCLCRRRNTNHSATFTVTLLC